WEDDIIKGVALTRDGAVIHPAFAGETKDAAAPEPEAAEDEAAPEPEDDAEAPPEPANDDKTA
ncbi:MAG: hypothetical protein ACX939_11785, partial [Hyphococcus sp.]